MKRGRKSGCVKKNSIRVKDVFKYNGIVNRHFDCSRLVGLWNGRKDGIKEISV